MNASKRYLLLGMYQRLEMPKLANPNRSEPRFKIKAHLNFAAKLTNIKLVTKSHRCKVYLEMKLEKLDTESFEVEKFFTRIDETLSSHYQKGWVDQISTDPSVHSYLLIMY